MMEDLSASGPMDRLDGPYWKPNPDSPRSRRLLRRRSGLELNGVLCASDSASDLAAPMDDAAATGRVDDDRFLYDSAEAPAASAANAASAAIAANAAKAASTPAASNSRKRPLEDPAAAPLVALGLPGAVLHAVDDSHPAAPSSARARSAAALSSFPPVAATGIWSPPADAASVPANVLAPISTGPAPKRVRSAAPAAEASAALAEAVANANAVNASAMVATAAPLRAPSPTDMGKETASVVESGALPAWASARPCGRAEDSANGDNGIGIKNSTTDEDKELVVDDDAEDEEDEEEEDDEEEDDRIDDVVLSDESAGRWDGVRVAGARGWLTDSLDLPLNRSGGSDLVRSSAPGCTSNRRRQVASVPPAAELPVAPVAPVAPIPSDAADLVQGLRISPRSLDSTESLIALRRTLHDVFRPRAEPRPHQLDAVFQIVVDIVRRARAGGLGATSMHDGDAANYLLQHGTGSGKSLTIACLTLVLLHLVGDDQRPLFSKVVVMNDRKQLDVQLGTTLVDFFRSHSRGEQIVVNPDSSEDLLLQMQMDDARSRVIVTTMQKFARLAGSWSARYPRIAIIADEAHRSHGHKTTQIVHEFLTGSSRQDARIVYFSFTSTPSVKSLQLFGVTDGSSRRPFHTYSIEQAVADGYTLNVLSDVTSALCTLEISPGPVRNGQVLPVRGGNDANSCGGARACGSIVATAGDHPVALREEHYLRLFGARESTQEVAIPAADAAMVRIKSAFIVRHLAEVVRTRSVGGFVPKAMLVSSGRPQVISYVYAIRALVRELLPPEEHFDVVAAFTSFKMETQRLSESDTPVNGEYAGNVLESFRNPASRVKLVVVASKYQTGFDEPLLHTLYIDKVLSGSNAVQTLGRVNRRAPGKVDTVIVDFVNSRRSIARAFGTYAGMTTLESLRYTSPLEDKLKRITQRLLDVPCLRDGLALRGLAAASLEIGRIDFWRDVAQDRTVESDLHRYIGLCDRLNVESPLLLYDAACSLRDELVRLRHSLGLNKFGDALACLNVDARQVVVKNTGALLLTPADLRRSVLGTAALAQPPFAIDKAASAPLEFKPRVADTRSDLQLASLLGTSSMCVASGDMEPFARYMFSATRGAPSDASAATMPSHVRGFTSILPAAATDADVDADTDDSEDSYAEHRLTRDAPLPRSLSDRIRKVATVVASEPNAEADLIRLGVHLQSRFSFLNSTSPLYDYYAGLVAAIRSSRAASVSSETSERTDASEAVDDDAPSAAPLVAPPSLVAEDSAAPVRRSGSLFTPGAESRQRSPGEDGPGRGDSPDVTPSSGGTSSVASPELTPAEAVSQLRELHQALRGAASGHNEERRAAVARLSEMRFVDLLWWHFLRPCRTPEAREFLLMALNEILVASRAAVQRAVQRGLVASCCRHFSFLCGRLRVSAAADPVALVQSSRLVLGALARVVVQLPHACGDCVDDAFVEALLWVLNGVSARLELDELAAEATAFCSATLAHVEGAAEMLSRRLDPVVLFAPSRPAAQQQQLVMLLRQLLSHKGSRELLLPRLTARPGSMRLHELAACADAALAKEAEFLLYAVLRQHDVIH